MKQSERPMWKKSMLHTLNLSEITDCLYEISDNGDCYGYDSCEKGESEFWDDNTFEHLKERYEPEDFDENGEYEYKTITTNECDNYKNNYLCEKSCVSWEELRKYIGQCIHNFYGWHISDLKIYDKPKELGDFFHTECIDERRCNTCPSCEYGDTCAPQS